jgi:glycosyltransferase involved in cell wall biosynthesis
MTRYGEDDSIVMRCIRSLAGQKNADIEVLFLDQREAPELGRQCEALSSARVKIHYEIIPAKSLSYARNDGLKKAKTDLVAFCDTDCELENNWAAEIIRTFEETGASLVGTKILPHWVEHPKWYHTSKYVLEFYSMLDIANNRLLVPKIVGASFVIDKRKLGAQAYFDEKLGRVNGKLLGGEETDLCARALKSGHSIFYTPFTHANHWVEPERMHLGWLWKRAFYGGVSRATRGGAAQAFNSTPRLVDYLALSLIIVPYVLGFGMTRLKGLRA